MKLTQLNTSREDPVSSAQKFSLLSRCGLTALLADFAVNFVQLLFNFYFNVILFILHFFPVCTSVSGWGTVANAQIPKQRRALGLQEMELQAIPGCIAFRFSFSNVEFVLHTSFFYLSTWHLPLTLIFPCISHSQVCTFPDNAEYCLGCSWTSVFK